MIEYIICIAIYIKLFACSEMCFCRMLWNATALFHGQVYSTTSSESKFLPPPSSIISIRSSPFLKLQVHVSAKQILSTLDFKKEITSQTEVHFGEWRTPVCNVRILC